MTRDNDSQPPSHDDHDADELLDAAIRAARTGPGPGATATAKDRAWARVLAASTASASGEAGCTEVRTEFGPFLEGRLSGGRAELIADHCRECLPCRRELVARRDGQPMASVPTDAEAPARRLRQLVPFGIAAGILAAAITTALLVRNPADGRPARVAQLDGQLILADGGGTDLREGASLAAGHSVRTGRGSRAILELPDGSRVEMNERAELRFAEDGQALTVDLTRGDIIVAAAKRRERNLFVRTTECNVAVKGTVFTVGRGLKGSRVAVLEGEVHVEEGGDLHVLTPGEQVATGAEPADQPLEDQVAWSLSREKWSTLVDEIDRAAAQVESEKIPPAIRYQSRILDAMPALTVFYAALPNGGGVARFAELVGQRVSGNPDLAPWWQAQVDGPQTPSVAGLLQIFGRLSSAVGQEVVVAFAVPPGDPDAHPMPVIVAPVANEAALRDAIAALPHGPGETPRLASLAELEASAGTERFSLVLHSGHVLAGPSSVVILQVAAGLDAPSRSATPFLDSVHAEYGKGTEFVLAADLATLVDRSLAAHAAKAPADQADELSGLVDVVGLDGLDRFVVTAGQENPGTATLSFRDDRRGMAAWLAEPGPMGSLDFITPQANVVFAAVFRDPKAMLRDIDERLGPKGLREGIESFRRDTGIDLLEDVAAPLGGEMAVALDGPLLPEPSWKLVVEVYDQQRLEQSIVQLVERADQWAKEHQQADDQPARRFSVADEQTPEGPARLLTLDRATIHYAYRDGYLVACPSLPLLAGALQARRTGSIADSAALRALLPKGADHVSFLAYQDLGSLLGELGQAAGNSTFLPVQARALASSGPMLLHARASDRAITFGLSAPDGGPAGHVAGVLRRALVHHLAERAAPAGQGIGYDAAMPDRQSRGTARDARP